jgi:hypothetical protein
VSRKHKDVSDINATAARAWSRKNEVYKKIDPELDDALIWLVANGLVRPVGLKNGEVLYANTPNSELSDEAKAFAASHGLDLSD